MRAMHSSLQKLDSAPSFRTKTAFGVAIIAILLVTPFAINNFIQDRPLLGTGNLVLVLLFIANAWYSYRGKYYPLLTLLGIAPILILYLAYAVGEQGIIGIFWCYPSVVFLYFMLPERYAWVANIILISVVSLEAWDILEPHIAVRFMVTLIGVSAFSVFFIRVISKQQHQLEERAITDSLTGLYNRSILNSTLETAVQQNRRAKTPMTIILLDMDHFKVINDTLGHFSGDMVLSGISELLQQRIRSSDKIFRIGGEEFLVLLHNTDRQSGMDIAEEIRARAESLELLPDHIVTLSAGVATLEPEEDWLGWMKRCDANLYRAKSNGRNQVVA